MNRMPDFDTVTATFMATLDENIEGHRVDQEALSRLLKEMWERGRGNGLAEAYDTIVRIEAQTERGSDEEVIMRDCCKQVWGLR